MFNWHEKKTCPKKLPNPPLKNLMVRPLQQSDARVRLAKIVLEQSDQSLEQSDQSLEHPAKGLNRQKHQPNSV